MMTRVLGVALLAGAVGLLGPPLGAQVRVTPKEAKGGEKQGEPWAEVPETFKSMKIPDWSVPTDLKRWQESDRGRTRETLLGCLGELPPRPDPRKVKVVSREDHDGYTLERFEFHNGIDMVAPYGTPVRASGAGRVVYVGWNYADGADPAFIVVIAHSANLSTWYAHLHARYPVRAGQTVRKGQVIGYEGNTGHSTGAHLHWMVEFNGEFVNPKLFT